MVSTAIRLYISYVGEDKKIVSFSKEKYTKETFLLHLKALFSINEGCIRLYESNSNAELMDMDDFGENDNLYIKVETSPPPQTSLISETFQINIDSLRNNTFEHDSLLLEVNSWAMPLKFKMIYSEGLKPTKNGYKRVLKCHWKGCQFALTFKSNKDKKDFRLDTKEQILHNFHAGKSI